MQKICAVKDTKTGLYDGLFTCRHENEAMREFAAVSKMPETKFGKHPADYQLFLMGTYNDASGEIIPLETPQHLSNGTDHAN